MTKRPLMLRQLVVSLGSGILAVLNGANEAVGMSDSAAGVPGAVGTVSALRGAEVGAVAANGHPVRRGRGAAADEDSPGETKAAGDANGVAVAGKGAVTRVTSKLARCLDYLSDINTILGATTVEPSHPCASFLVQHIIPYCPSKIRRRSFSIAKCGGHFIIAMSGSHKMDARKCYEKALDQEAITAGEFELLMGRTDWNEYNFLSLPTRSPCAARDANLQPKSWGDGEGPPRFCPQVQRWWDTARCGGPLNEESPCTNRDKDHQKSIPLPGELGGDKVFVKKESWRDFKLPEDQIQAGLPRAVPPMIRDFSKGQCSEENAITKCWKEFIRPLAKSGEISPTDIPPPPPIAMVTMATPCQYTTAFLEHLNREYPNSLKLVASPYETMGKYYDAVKAQVERLRNNVVV